MATSSAMSTTNDRIKYNITVTQNSQSVTNNTSNVTVSVRFYRTNTGYTSYGSGTVYCKINGTTYSEEVTPDDKITSSGIVLFTKTLNISHNADGTKTLATSAWINHSVVSSSEQSYSQVLTTIPRATTPTLSASSVNMGASITINMPRASSSFTHTLTYKLGSATGTIGSGLGTSASWTVPLSLANQVPSATSGTCTITCQTYNGSTLIGTKTASFTALVPSSVVPSISSVSISEAVAGIASKFGAYIQNRSKLNVGIAASGIYGSSITQYKTYIQAVEYQGNSFVSNTITASGTIGIVTVVTDSRGRTARYDGSISVLPYSTPTISVFSAYRSDSLGNQNYEGRYLNISLKYLITNVNNLNDKYYEVVYRVKGTSSWSFIESGNIYSKDTSIITEAVFDPDNAYDLALNVYDYFSEAHVAIDIPTAFTLMDYHSSGKGIAFGKVAEKVNTMEIALDVDLSGKLLQESRTTPTLLNSWQNYGTSYESAVYWKDKCNVVHLGGMVKGGTVTDGTVIFALPSGYRPRSPEKFITVSVNAICILDIYTNGNVTIRAGANASWLSLSGISFIAEN